MKYLTSDSLNSLLKPFSGWFDAGSSIMNGYLTVEAVRNHEETEKDEKSNYVFRERTYGRMSRTFYVGDGIREENIKAKYDNGILTVVVPKYREEEKPLKRIAVE